MPRFAYKNEAESMTMDDLRVASMLTLLASVFGLALLLASCGGSGNGNGQGDCHGAKCDIGAADPEKADNHVELVHLDGFRPDVFAALLERGHLPTFEYLNSRGLVSFEATTVDKSETMKVVQSYLTGRLDTYVVGWWQFNRDEYGFRNFWLEPAQVLNFALGLEFPLYPTIQDFVRNSGGNLTSGMSLARRGVPFNNYARPYLEGFQATSNHRYFNQARATMEGHLDIFRRIAQSEEATPRLSTLLLAPADEFAHSEGVTADGEGTEHCFERDSGIDTAIFEIVENDQNHLNGNFVHALENRYFSEIDWSWFGVGGSVNKLCIPTPTITAHTLPSTRSDSDIGDPAPRRVLPEYALAMIQVDIELGYLVNTLKSIRFTDDGERYYSATVGDPSTETTGDESLFDRTLFVFLGDHGMVDSPYGMAPDDKKTGASTPGPGVSFIDYLNERLNLDSQDDAELMPPGAELGIDFGALPQRLRSPHRFLDWQDSATRVQTQFATNWAEEFFVEIQDALRTNLHEKYWWLFFLRSAIVDPRLDENLNPVRDQATDILANLYLRSVPDYRQAERRATAAFYDEHVRLVYGGGARNNADFFIPGCDSSGCSWSRRPTFEQIFSYKGGTGSSWTLIDVLRTTPAVGLIFVREDNHLISSGGALPAQMRVMVMDRDGNRGRITIRRDLPSGELVFHYRVDPGSRIDPLQYGDLGLGEGTYGTHNEWNDLSVLHDHYYRNAVAGVGAYLYSSNPSIGDVVVFHSQGWNFGANRAGHGGIHRGEKRTVMMVSGPGIVGDTLWSQSRYRTEPDGSVVADATRVHQPTILDAAPTALAWLGYPDGALPAFARGALQTGREPSDLAGHASYEAYVQEWVSQQRNDVLDNIGGVDSLNQALTEAGFDEFRIGQFRLRLEDLFRFMSEGDPVLEDYSGARLDGNALRLY